MNAKELIQKLGLKPHPEGGFYIQTYKSSQIILSDEGNSRHISTAIYYLLENKDKSHFHRIKSEELWFFHLGEPLEIVIIQDGSVSSIILGNKIENGELPQALIPANTWFAAKVKNEIGYTLVSCTVAPGFEFEDFELAKRENLILNYPHLKKSIEAFTK